MKKIILIILGVVLLGGIGFFIFSMTQNMSDEIEVDVQESLVASASQAEKPVTKEEVKASAKEKKIKPPERELTAKEKYEKSFEDKLVKAFGTKDINKASIRIGNLTSVLNDGFINKKWSEGSSEVKSKMNREIYAPSYLTTHFIDKYSSEGLESFDIDKNKDINSVIVSAYPEEIYIIFDLEDSRAYFTSTWKDKKLDDIELSFIEYNDSTIEINAPFNRLTFERGIPAFCIDNLYNIKIAGTENLKLEKKGENNYLSPDYYEYRGLWKDNDGFYSNWESKYLNFAIAVTSEDKDYEERYTATFKEKDGEITDLKFIIQKKRLLGDSDKREDRLLKQEEENKKEQERLTRQLERSLEEEKNRILELQKEFKKRGIKEYTND